MTVTVAIPTLNRPGDMAAFMPTLAHQTVLPDQFIVVDAGEPSDLEAQMQEALGHTGMELVYMRSEKGLCIQRNRALEECRRGAAAQGQPQTKEPDTGPSQSERSKRMRE